MNSYCKFRGFTLVELVIVILLLGLISTLLFNIIRGPLVAYIDIQRRADLVDIAETALQRMTREIRLALPNSIRYTGTTGIEFIRTIDGGRYRRLPHPGGATTPCGTIADNKISFTSNTDCFEVMGSLDNLPAAPATGTTQSACATQNALCLVIYNTGQIGANAYDLDNIAAISAITSNSVTFNNSDIPTFRFPFKSPYQRFQIIDTPVSFICAGTNIMRYSNYEIKSITVPTGGTSANLLVDNISSCAFNYDPGTSTRAGLVTISLTITDNDSGESVSLLQQAHVDNQP